MDVKNEIILSVYRYGKYYTFSKMINQYCVKVDIEIGEMWATKSIGRCESFHLWKFINGKWQKI